MNLINELRMLAEDLYSARGHNRYAVALSKAADEIESLERYCTAYNEWIDKTEWVQADTSLPAKYLGMHRADVLKDMISDLLDRLKAAEKERDATMRLADSLALALNTSNHERDNLRAKIAEMEKQEPVWWQTRTRPTWNDGTWGQWRKCSEEYAQDVKKTPLLHDWLYEARALYGLPGAQTQGEEK